MGSQCRACVELREEQPPPARFSLRARSLSHDAPAIARCSRRRHYVRGARRRRLRGHAGCGRGVRRRDHHVRPSHCARSRRGRRGGGRSGKDRRRVRICESESRVRGHGRILEQPRDDRALYTWLWDARMEKRCASRARRRRHSHDAGRRRGGIRFEPGSALGVERRECRLGHPYRQGCARAVRMGERGGQTPWQ